jgi:hypothetical protein
VEKKAAAAAAIVEGSLVAVVPQFINRRGVVDKKRKELVSQESEGETKNKTKKTLHPKLSSLSLSLSLSLVFCGSLLPPLASKSGDELQRRSISVEN